MRRPRTNGKRGVHDIVLLWAPGLWATAAGYGTFATLGGLSDFTDERAAAAGLPPVDSVHGERSSASDLGGVWGQQACAEPLTLGLAGSDSGAAQGCGTTSAAKRRPRRGLPSTSAPVQPLTRVGMHSAVPGS